MRRDRKYDKSFRLFQDAADSTCSYNDNPYRAVCRSIYLCFWLRVCVFIYKNICSSPHVKIYIYTHTHSHVSLDYC